MPKPPMDPLGRPVEHAMSVSELERALGEASRRSGWKKADRYDLLEVWGSRTASIYRCRGRDEASDVVLKVGHGWSTNDARSLDERLRVLRSRLDPSIVRTPEPLGWASDPPAVCTRYVEGTDLYFMLRDLGHPAWDSARASATTLLTRCGMALAHIHASPEGLPEDAAARAVERMRSAARALRLRPIATSLTDLMPVFGFGDVGPHQFRIAEGGRVWVLDPPTDPAPALPHEDIAMFIFGVDKLVVSGGAGSRRFRRATGAAFREAFLGGYGRSGVIDPRQALDRWLVRLFETRMAAGTAKRRIRDREVLDAGRMLSRSAAGQVWLRSYRPRDGGQGRL